MFSEKTSFSDIIFQSEKMRSVIETAKKFAVLDAPLLIQGETGTGKDLFARACHNLSPRGTKKFIAINCAGLPPEDAESEMFGHSDGNNETIGFFEYADGGTVLLDGISELSLYLQAKLLRFITDGTFKRVGEEKGHYANVRVICTSQVPLHICVKQGKMRGDLFHRLDVLTINIPSLRERPEDIDLLLPLFIKQISTRLSINQPSYNDTFLSYLKNYTWSGNIRELYNALFRACSLSENNQLSVSGLNLIEQEILSLTVEQFQDETLDEIMGKFEAMVLQKFYSEYPSTRKLAARLGVSHTAIANKLKQYGIAR
ncbi:transcriptional regulator of aroF, aroG, tyrA and aromatic amino acid transport [Bisgaardia hudsonensis]|uniref:HTH-type transcriptional regulatory protein TyrR n=1 Tax=Bisgaardia hudsonensis TaxID=109472 RepID=A0A4R2N388_9PAST|nr:sigma 54-interacting transcriptional regulator [Bisgaardia hudsonensis]QLB12825.1 transcriptional regulator [Bisgaardia hudsonensis]TCP14383.1 transcriptional regulator of aroF, aroG, tyrA and aromatic amino acid transport [Bisgaardia hudsonensis]